jgi:hypothetical protein
VVAPLEVRDMTCAFLWLALSIGAGRVPTDLAGLMPGGTTVYLEVSDLSHLAAGLKDAPVLDKLQVEDPAALRRILKDLAASGVRTAAIGLDPSALGVRRWVVVGAADDVAAAASLVKTWTKRELPTGAVGRFLVFGDSAARIAEVRELSESKGESLADQAAFRAFRASIDASAPIRFFCDVKTLWPRPFRTQIRNPSHVGWVLLGAHLTHVLRTVATVSGTMSLEGGVEASVSAEIREPDARAFTEVNPTQDVIAMPSGFAARLSVSRSLGRFWTRRTTILGDAAQATVSSVAATVATILPGCAVEVLIEQIGEAFDVYVSSSATSAPAAAPPPMALVAVTVDRAQRCRLLAEIPRLLGALANKGGAARPYREESFCHRGIELRVARPDSCDRSAAAVWGDGAGPTFAVVKDRVIIGNRPSTVIAIVDQLLDARVLPRAAGDELELDGPSAARLLRDASAAMMPPEDSSESRPTAFLGALEGFLAGVQTARVSFDLAGKEASLRVGIDAPALFSADRPASRPK